MQHHHDFITGSAGKLESLYIKGRDDMPAVVVCHPHPQFGGTMRNKVVYWMARTFEDAGCSVLRFNFRGVERSEGNWDEGCGEADDAATALQWIAHQHPSSPLWITGFSFGCYAGLSAAVSNPSVTQMIAVAPAVNLHNFAFMRQEERPCTIIQGSDDDIVPCKEVREWASGFANMDYYEITDAGHFFPKHMNKMTEIIADLLKRYI